MVIIVNDTDIVAVPIEHVDDGQFFCSRNSDGVAVFQKSGTRAELVIQFKNGKWQEAFDYIAKCKI